jgi:hypothetical protein
MTNPRVHGQIPSHVVYHSFDISHTPTATGKKDPRTSTTDVQKVQKSRRCGRKNQGEGMDWGGRNASLIDVVIPGANDGGCNISYRVEGAGGKSESQGIGG